MRTNIMINEELMQKAIKVTGLSTKKAVVQAGLELLIRLNDQQKLRQLRGAAEWSGDLHKMRLDE